MAANNKTAQSSFYELVFQGKPKVVRAFLSGLVMGSGKKATLFYSFLEGVHHEGKSEKLKEMVGIRAVDCHVIVDARTSALLKSLNKRLEAETGLRITAHRRIRSASLAFAYVAYARRYDEDILAAVKKLPAGLKLRGFKHDVRLDPKAKGVEAYSPTHHFEATGAGEITGPVDKVIAMKHRFADYPLVKAEDVILKLA